MHFKKSQTLAMILLLFLWGVLLQGCAEQPPEEETVIMEETEEAPTTSIDVSVSLPAEAMGRMMTAVGVYSDIASVKIQVRLETDGSLLVPETALQETPEGSGTWTGMISNLPVFESLVFEANAYNADGQVLFSDTVTKHLSDGASAAIILEMTVIDDGLDPENPRIVSLTAPSEIVAGSVNNPLIFKLEHDAPVHYSLSSERGVITSPLEGEHEPFTDLEIAYDAPATSGIDTIRISVKDPELDDTISTEYALTIVEGEVDAGITVIFGPAITAIHFLRTENGLQISSETVPATGLLYQWQGSGSFSAFSSAQNPAEIAAFSDNDSGEIRLTVTDENGIQSAISRGIAPGDFPYDVLVSETPEPVDTVLDIASLLLWQDDASHPFLSHADAIDFCRSSFDAGGYMDWRLPTRRELKGLYLRRNILQHRLPYSYWTSELSSRDASRAWYRAFGWGYESLKRTSHYSFVRCVRNWE